MWGAIKKDADFGRALVESVCYQTLPASKLEESEAAEFYLWLVKTFPPSEDPEVPMGVAFHVSTRMEITKWRNSFLEDLKQRGTPKSLIELEKIAATSPELEQRLHWILIEARENVRRHTWQPPSPDTLLTLLKQTIPEAKLAVPATAMKVPLSDEEIKKLSWNGKLVADTPALFEFLKIYRDHPNDVVFFVGAGLSRPLFPSWEVALEELVTQTSKRFGYTDREAELRSMLSNGAFLDVADTCALDLGKNNYRAFIEQQFDKDFALEDVPQPYAALLNLHPQMRMCINPCVLIATN